MTVSTAVLVGVTIVLVSDVVVVFIVVLDVD